MSRNRKQRGEEFIQPNTQTAFRIEANINNLKRLLESPIFQFDADCKRYSPSVFIDVVITLHDLLQVAANASNADLRVRITDSVGIIPNEIEDVTDLVSKVRNAVCHINSGNRDAKVEKVERLQFIFCSVPTKSRVNVVNDFVMENEFDDDIAFYYGENRIYLQRHIVAATNAAFTNLVPLIRHKPNLVKET